MNSFVRMVAFDFGALDGLMPMHVLINKHGDIEKVGPTFEKLRPNTEFLGKNLFQIFELRRPRISKRRGLDFTKIVGQNLRFEFLTVPRTPLKGVLVRLPDTTSMLLNLSFGISVVDAVRDYALTIRDFASTDLTVEMLYQFEAKNVIMNESRNLNARLQDARMVAEEQALTDVLTGLKNRRAMDELLSKMTLSRIPFGLMHLDLDYFKEVNDTFGHAAGDKVLQSSARLLLEETRSKDTVARVGGDEFVLVFDNLVNEKKLMAIANRIVTRLEEPSVFQGQTCKISGSIGITTSNFYDIPEPDRMLSDADIALYASKSGGRACATIATEALLTSATSGAR